MRNKFRIAVCGITLGAAVCFCTIINAALLTFNIPTAGNPLTMTTTIVTDNFLIGTISDSQNTTGRGDLSASVDVTVNPVTRQISATNISFIEQTPGHITLDPMTFTLSRIVTETVTTTTLSATPKSPSGATALTPSGNGFTFPVNTTQLVINQGSLSATGVTAYDQNFQTAPITTSMQSGSGTLTFHKISDTLTSLVYSINLNVPVSFDNVITSGSTSVPILGTVNYTVSMSGSGTLLADTTTYSQSYANMTVYWDTSTAAGLQAGNGTWSTSNHAWSTSTQGSNPLYSWTADAGTLNAYFGNFSGSDTSTVTVSGGVSAKALIINGTGYSFTGGTVTVNSGGIIASESATIDSGLTLGAAQTWTPAANKTLIVNGNVSAGANALTIRGAGEVSLSGVNSLNLVKVGDSSSVGNLTLAGGTTTIANGLILGYGNIGNGTANLNAGTLSVASVSRSAGSTAATIFNFNGGTLQAVAAECNFHDRIDQRLCERRRRKDRHPELRYHHRPNAATWGHRCNRRRLDEIRRRQADPHRRDRLYRPHHDRRWNPGDR